MILGSTQFIQWLPLVPASAPEAGGSSLGGGGGGRRGQVGQGHLTLGWSDGGLPGPRAATDTPLACRPATLLLLLALLAD